MQFTADVSQVVAALTRQRKAVAITVEHSDDHRVADTLIICDDLWGVSVNDVEGLYCLFGLDGEGCPHALSVFFDLDELGKVLRHTTLTIRALKKDPPTFLVKADESVYFYGER